MGEILQDLSSPRLAAVIEKNLYEFFPLFRQWTEMELHNDPEMLWSITHIPFPLFNNVLWAKLTPETIDTAIQKTISRYQARNVPMMWWVGPTTSPVNLGDYLQRHGFVQDEGVAGMAVDLQVLNDTPSSLPGLVIEQVGDIETLRKWEHVYSVSFGMPDFVGDAFFDFYCSLGFNPQTPYYNYIGWLNGVPVATASLLLGTEVAGIYNIATLPEMRRQGIGTAMTRQAMREAYAKGYQVAILHATQMAFNIYTQLGFREYCKINHYFWTAEAL